MPYPLFDFAYVPDIESKLQHLSSIAQRESWDYRFALSDKALPVLYSYIHYTFSRVQDEHKIAIIDSERACFNTGLNTENYEDIFALFEPNRQTVYKQKWCLKGFYKESDRELLKIGALPEIANYFDDPSDLLYDTRLVLRKNIDHIIDDNKDRFPNPFKSMDDNHQLRIALSGAIDHAIKRIKRNYKTAIPQFYQGSIQLLLPLCMTNDSKADLALVVYKENDVYLASTCLTLDMAYNNARLLSKPDSEWLVP